MKEFAIIVSIHLKPGKETVMSRIIVLYYSTHGHIETMAQAVARVKRAEVSWGLHRIPCETPVGIVLIGQDRCGLQTFL